MKETQTQARRRALLKKHAKRLAVSALCTAILIPLLCISAYAEPIFTVDLASGEGGNSFGLLDALLLVALLALAPSILVMVTSFLRIIIVLSFVRSAMGTQQSPPNQVLIGLALFLTLFIMSPVLTEIKEQAYEPYRAGLEISDAPSNDELMELSMAIVVPAFATSELKRAFTMGFMLFIPFLIIDMVVSSALMSMGMVMLPPTTIALPFKIMLFVLVDGWGLLFSALVRSFHT